MQFTRRGLEEAGFVGWLPFANLRTSTCPPQPGVYVICLDAGYEPIGFAERSCGGWHKGRDPSVTLDVLTANWVDGAEVVYIGKASRRKRSLNGLKARLSEYADFGAGRPVAHWAVASSGSCLISTACWSHGEKRQNASPAKSRSN